jgi:anti-sigma regulatory factor (Ser/Thr protein kinase)
VRPHVATAVADDLELRSTELVTNSLRHNCGLPSHHIRFEVDLQADRVRAAVTDDGYSPDRPAVRYHDDESIGGRGLAIVDHLANRWDVDIDGGVTVWFELPLSQ